MTVSSLVHQYWIQARHQIFGCILKKKFFLPDIFAAKPSDDDRFNF
jgi:hypothetical protein